MPTDPTSAPNRPHRQLSAALALLHRTLLQAEAEAASLTGNPYALLGAVMHDPRFAWLKPMTQLMVSLDEMGAKGATPPIAALVPHLETTDRLLDGPPLQFSELRLLRQPQQARDLPVERDRGDRQPLEGGRAEDGR